MATRKTTIIKPVSVSERLETFGRMIDNLEKRVDNTWENSENRWHEIKRDVLDIDNRIETERMKKKRQQEMFWIYVLVAVYVIFIAVYTVRTFQRR